ncbi:MAG: hypothetical protein ACE363_09680 [Alphaproteobacteria bacterium]
MRHEALELIPDSLEAERDLQVFFTVVNAWGVRNCHAQGLLGYPDQKAYYQWKRGFCTSVPRSVLDRIAIVRTIDRVRQTVYWSDAEWIRWLDSPNRLLNKVAPIEHMANTSIEGLVEFRGLLQRLRS